MRKDNQFLNRIEARLHQVWLGAKTSAVWEFGYLLTLVPCPILVFVYRGLLFPDCHTYSFHCLLTHHHLYTEVFTLAVHKNFKSSHLCMCKISYCFCMCCGSKSHKL